MKTVSYNWTCDACKDATITITANAVPSGWTRVSVEAEACPMFPSPQEFNGVMCPACYGRLLDALCGRVEA